MELSRPNDTDDETVRHIHDGLALVWDIPNVGITEIDSVLPVDDKSSIPAITTREVVDTTTETVIPVDRVPLTEGAHFTREHHKLFAQLMLNAGDAEPTAETNAVSNSVTNHLEPGPGPNFNDPAKRAVDRSDHEEPAELPQKAGGTGGDKPPDDPTDRVVRSGDAPEPSDLPDPEAAASDRHPPQTDKAEDSAEEERVESATIAATPESSGDKPNVDAKYDQTNPQRLSAIHYRKMYEGLGINLSSLGCIMLDTEPVVVSDVIAEKDLYYANDPIKYPHAKGIVSEIVPHVTLLQGLLQPGPEIRQEVDTVLQDWAVNSVTISEITYFAGADPNEPFDCIVARLDASDELKEGYNRLQLLPHITMYPGEYRAHISLAYIKRNPEQRDAYIRALTDRYVGRRIRVRGINYGF